jgi:hypothetical protein
MLFLNLNKHLSLISILYLVNKYKKSHSSPGKCYPASKVLSYFFSAGHGEARETLQNLCIFFVEPTIQKLG